MREIKAMSRTWRDDKRSRKIGQRRSLTRWWWGGVTAVGGGCAAVISLLSFSFPTSPVAASPVESAGGAQALYHATALSVLTSPARAISLHPVRVKAPVVAQKEHAYILEVRSANGGRPRALKGWCEVTDSFGGTRATVLEGLPAEPLRLLGQQVTCQMVDSAGGPLLATLRLGDAVVHSAGNQGNPGQDVVISSRSR